jgi:tRNA threonylcarbamoyladenosine biosynthesis protein TsaE
LRQHFSDPDITVRSPTYTYYEKYGKNIYHFDLYRVESLEDIFLIGAHDIFADPDSICLIEWPEILQDDVKPTLCIEIEKVEEDKRKFTLR